MTLRNILHAFFLAALLILMSGLIFVLALMTAPAGSLPTDPPPRTTIR